VIWRSSSLAIAGGTSNAPDAPPGLKLPPGSFVFRETERRFEMFYRVIWETEGDQVFTFRVIADQRPFRAAISSFRRTLMLGVAAVVVALMGAQVFAVAWGLRPVAAMAARIEAIEAGSEQRMGDEYPPELSGLARNIDRFIDHETNSRDRYRRAMDDLAHSLKTRCGAAQCAASSPTINRCANNSIVWRLGGASVVARPGGSTGDAGRHTAPRGARAPDQALGTTYTDKAVVVERRVAADLLVRCTNATSWILGNLLENAFQYCRNRVIVDAQGGPMARVTIDDDDRACRRPAIAGARGARADTVQPGQHRLAVVAELAASYRGTLAIDAAPLAVPAPSWNYPARRPPFPGPRYSSDQACGKIIAQPFRRRSSRRPCTSDRRSAARPLPSRGDVSCRR
jgi:two-component system sensor histidine kinase PhoQ